MPNYPRKKMTRQEIDNVIARLSPSDRERLARLDHGDRSEFVPFDLDLNEEEKRRIRRTNV